MKPCLFSIPENRERLLTGSLSAAETAAWREHLSSPCDACLDALEPFEVQELLGRLTGHDADLSPSELASCREAWAPRPWWQVWRPWDGVQTLPAWRDTWQGILARPWIPAAAAAAVLLLLVVRPLLRQEPPMVAPLQTSRDKQAASVMLPPELVVVVATMDQGTPRVLRRLGPDESLHPGEMLLFRYRLEQAAHVVLLGQAVAPGAAQVLWQSEGLVPAGEYEVSAEGNALALDPRRLGSKISLALVASSMPVATQLSPTALDLERLDEGQEMCPGCSVSRVHVEAESP